MAQSLDLLTTSEVARELRCSKAHVCNLINGRVKGVLALPAIRAGRRLLVRRPALQSWIEQTEGVIIPTGIDAVDAPKGEKIDA